MRTLLQWIASRLPYREITDPQGDVFLTKYLLLDRGSRWRLHLHQFHRADQDRELHNHPWQWAVSLVLSGGYIEARWVAGKGRTTCARMPGTMYAVLANTFHRVDSVLEEDCWTLFLSGPVVQSWGFLDDGGETATWTPWRKFLNDKAARDEAMVGESRSGRGDHRKAGAM